MNNKQADKILKEVWEKFEKMYPHKGFFTIGQMLRFGKEIANLALNSGHKKSYRSGFDAGIAMKKEASYQDGKRKGIKLGKEKAVCSICGKEGLLFCGECRNCDDCESIVKSNEKHIIKKAKQELWDDIKGQHDIDPDRYLSECFVCEHEKEIKSKHKLK